MKKRGFVLIELAIVFGMLAVLIGMTTINVFGSNRKASLTATVDTLVADLRSQQTKAMSGTTNGGSVPVGYGVHFEATRYILFEGASYSAALMSNAAIPLDTRVTFSEILLPNQNVVFASRSGEFVGFATPSSSLTINQLDSGETKTIHLNKYGVITSIN